MDLMAHRKLCRLCLCHSKCFMDVFEENASLGFTVAKTLEDLLQIKVMGDKYPWLACSTCVEKLIDFRLFKSRCLDSKVTFEKRFHITEHEAVINPNSEDPDGPGADVSDGYEKSQIKEECDASEMCKVIIKMEKEGDSDENWETYNDESLTTDSSDSEIATETVEIGGMSSSVEVSLGKILSPTGVTPVDISEECNLWIKEEPMENEESKGNAEFDPAECAWPGIKMETPSSCAAFHPAEEVPFKVSEVVGGDSILSANSVLISKELSEVIGDSGEQETHDSTSLSCGRAPLCRIGETFHQNSVSLKSLLRSRLVNLASNGENANSESELRLANGVVGETKPGKLMNGDVKIVSSCDIVDKQSVSTEGRLLKRAVPNSDLQCSKCKLRFKSQGRLKKHHKWHKSKVRSKAKTKHQCQQCGKVFSYLQCYKTHLKKHGKSVLYQCPKCLEFFKTEESIAAHMKTHLMVHRCQYCDLSFCSEREHLVHESTHQGAKAFLCGECDSTFSTSEQLRLHESAHAPPFKCTVCGSDFDCSRALEEHRAGRGCTE